MIVKLTIHTCELFKNELMTVLTWTRTWTWTWTSHGQLSRDVCGGSVLCMELICSLEDVSCTCNDLLLKLLETNMTKC